MWTDKATNDRFYTMLRDFSQNDYYDVHDQSVKSCTGSKYLLYNSVIKYQTPKHWKELQNVHFFKYPTIEWGEEFNSME